MANDLTVTNMDLWQSLTSANPDISPALVRLSKLDAPILASNMVRKILRKAREAGGDIDESRKALIEKHTQADGASDGEIAVASKAFETEFNLLLAEPVTLSDVRKVKLSEFGKVNVSGEVLELCAAFLDDDLPA